jgi:hypothetical protein
MGDYLKRMGSKIALGLVGVAVLFGFKFYQRSSSASETRAELVTICEGDAACKAAVEKHFETCHEQAYRLGGRRSSGGLNAKQLTACINTAAGEDYFAAE